MTDSIRLKEAIRNSGYRIKFISDRLGLSYYGFQKKVNNESDFKAKEIMALCELLNIDAKDRELIFFAHDVDKISTQ